MQSTFFGQTDSERIQKKEKHKLLRVNDRVSSFTFTYISSRIQSPKKKLQYYWKQSQQ